MRSVNLARPITTNPTATAPRPEGHQMSCFCPLVYTLKKKNQFCQFLHSAAYLAAVLALTAGRHVGVVKYAVAPARSHSGCCNRLRRPVASAASRAIQQFNPRSLCDSTRLVWPHTGLHLCVVSPPHHHPLPRGKTGGVET